MTQVVLVAGAYDNRALSAHDGDEHSLKDRTNSTSPPETAGRSGLPPEFHNNEETAVPVSLLFVTKNWISGEWSQKFFRLPNHALWVWMTSTC